MDPNGGRREGDLRSSEPEAPANIRTGREHVQRNRRVSSVEAASDDLKSINERCLMDV